jgi:hypothetical protein
VQLVWSFLFSRHLCTTRVVVIIYIHKLMLIRILSSDWPISIQVPSKLKKNHEKTSNETDKSLFCKTLKHRRLNTLFILSLSPVYTMQVLHPSLHSSFLIVYTIQKTWTDLDGIEMHPIFFSTWMELGWRLANQKTESLSSMFCKIMTCQFHSMFFRGKCRSKIF